MIAPSSRHDLWSASAESTHFIDILSPHTANDHMLTAMNPLRRKDVRRRFDRAADGFADGDFVHRHCFEGLLERLLPMRLETRRILDLGSAIGAGSRQLAKLSRRTRVTSLDLSAAMLKQARARHPRFSRISEVQADAASLPFRQGVFDLVVANLLLPWVGDPQDTFTGIARILREGGLFLFATLGPDSLIELRDAWREEDQFEHVNPFMDMHDVGDALVRAGLRDPVLDVDWLSITFRDSPSLFKDLTAAGARNSLAGRRGSLTGKARLGRVGERLQERAGSAPLTVNFELLYGHAWGGGPPGQPGEYPIDPGSIGRIRR